jgi:predicted AlkP superfamily pyrophosphatase or phosphodiesterase
MKRFALVTVVLLLLLAACSPARGPIRHVILISVDGLMPAAYLAPDEYGLQVPTLREMAARGAYSPAVESVFPTLTYPAHTSLATGVRPARHGIVSNYVWDPLDRLRGQWRWYAEDIRVPTLWDAARDRGLRTALVYWPVTVGARATALVPEYWRTADGSEEDQKLLRALATPGLLDEVHRRFPDFYEHLMPPRVADVPLTHVAVHLVEKLRPHLLLLHIFDVDHYQHGDGPLAGRGLEAIENADRQIARVIQAARNSGIWQNTALVVVSDHGFAAHTQRVRPGIPLAERGLITLDERGRVADWRAWLLSSTGMGMVYVRDENDEAAKRAVTEIYGALAARPSSGIGRVFTREEIIAYGGDPQAYLAIEPAEGFGFSSGYTGEYSTPSPSLGLHGLAPDRPEMHASLLVYGPAIGAARLEGARLIDVAPTIAGWLGLRMDQVEGRALEIPLAR